VLHSTTGIGISRIRGASIADMRGDVELAVLALSPYEVLRADRASAACGDVRALVVLLEDSGPVDTDELVASCRAEGMRLVGPHCLGVFNSDPASRSTPRSRRCGPRRVASRSPPRAVHPGIAALALAAQHGVGLSSFVSMERQGGPLGQRPRSGTGRPTPAPTW
jgi:acyl-CoA synthetase (NDP forming)